MWSAATQGSAVLGRSGANLQQFTGLIESLSAETKAVALSRATERVIERTGLREHYRKEKGEQAEARLENLDELISATRSFEPRVTDAPPEEGATPQADPLTELLTHPALEAGERQAGPGEASTDKRRVGTEWVRTGRAWW